MKVKDIYNEYQQYTKVVTETGRTLAFGAAAVGWAFRTEEFTFPRIVLLTLFFVVLFFLLDILQFFIAAICLKHFANKKEAEILKRNGNLEDEEVTKPLSFNKVPYVLFLLKFPCLLFAYMSLGVEFILRILNV